MRLLVAGGAGFIGANFVHGCVLAHPTDEVYGDLGLEDPVRFTKPLKDSAESEYLKRGQ